MPAPTMNDAPWNQSSTTIASMTRTCYSDTMAESEILQDLAQMYCRMGTVYGRSERQTRYGCSRILKSPHQQTGTPAKITFTSSTYTSSQVPTCYWHTFYYLQDVEEPVPIATLLLPMKTNTRHSWISVWCTEANEESNWCLMSKNDTPRRKVDCSNLSWKQ